MRHLRLMMVALFAIMALAAVTAGSASAEEPALITYSGNGTFSIASGKGKLETSDKIVVECEGDNGNGQLGGSGVAPKVQAKTAELTVLFTGCTSVGKICTSTGAPSGTIVANPLIALLGRISPGVAGIRLVPKTGTQFVQSTKCGTITFTAASSVIGELKTVDKQTKVLTAVFKPKVSAPGLQAVKSFEGEATVNNLIAEVGRGPEEASLESEETLTLNNGEGILLA